MYMEMTLFRYLECVQGYNSVCTSIIVEYVHGDESVFRYAVCVQGDDSLCFYM